MAIRKIVPVKNRYAIISRDFDCFVINYLTAKDRVDYLMESVTESARKEKNFYLYHMYRESVNEEQRLKKLIH